LWAGWVKAGVKELDPYGSSSYCSRCGWENRDLNGAVFECKECGLRIDRQLNAAINLYMRMRFGYQREVGWWKEACTTEDGGRFPEGVVGPRGSTLPLMGGCIDVT